MAAGFTIQRKGDFGFDKNIQRLISEKRILPIQIANDVQNHFLLGFRKGGKQTDDSLSGWVKRKKEDKRKDRRAILIKSGHLRNSIKKLAMSWSNGIIVGSEGIPYAEYHNFGDAPQPKREFIGDSKELENKIYSKIDKAIQSIFK